MWVFEGLTSLCEALICLILGLTLLGRCLILLPMTRFPQLKNVIQASSLFILEYRLETCITFR